MWCKCHCPNYIPICDVSVVIGLLLKGRVVFLTVPTCISVLVCMCVVVCI